MTLIGKRKNYKVLFLISMILLLLIIFFASTLGATKIPFMETIKVILNKIPWINKYISLQGIKKSHMIIILNIRLPRIILSALVGTALAGAGVVFQGIFKNPMADPYVLGVSSGAALGATLAMILNFTGILLGLGALNIMAFGGAIAVTLIVYNISRVGNRTPVVTLLLAGLALNFFISALISLLMTLNRNEVEKIVFWTMGSVSAASWKHVIAILPFVIIGSFIIYVLSRDLNIVLMGEETAKNLGIEVEKVKKIALIVGSIVAASAVSVSGIVGFVGLIVPHMIRLIVGPNHKVLIPFTLVAGGMFVVIADTLSRILIPPIEIPLGVITSLFGAPYFIYLLCKNKTDIFKG
ncbi:MAG: cobalamin transport system permease protein [Candidatus Petromonas sp.]|jgi:iron complex transport system permease protein|nr:cobalamin transport system permease protein [Candidatus Petromonas sp.]